MSALSLSAGSSTFSALSSAFLLLLADFLAGFLLVVSLVNAAGFCFLLLLPVNKKNIITPINMMLETTINIMPIFEFDETSDMREFEGNTLLDFWGYNTTNFFSPNAAYAAKLNFVWVAFVLLIIFRSEHKSVCAN